MLRTSVIIATYNRPDDLRACIGSLLRQTRRPGELIVVDDGALDALPLAAECAAADIACLYRRKAAPGLTRSRNLGIGLAGGDILLFLDDDVVLAPGFIEHISTLYEQDPGHTIGGVGGVVVNHPPLTLGRRLRHWLDILLLNSGTREGRVLPSGFCTSFGETGAPVTAVQAVEFLSGCAMSYRREVCAALRFDEEHYLRYSYGEDKDYSYRVSRRWRLLLHPAATLLHRQSPAMRPDTRRMGYMYVVSRWLFFTRYLDRGPLRRLAFVYALAGYTLVRTLVLLLRPHRARRELARLHGVLQGIGAILAGRRNVE